MKYVLIAALAAEALVSCASVNTSKALHLKAYSPNESSPQKLPDYAEWSRKFMEDGVIYELSEGDIIRFDVTLGGELLEKVGTGQFRVKKKTYVFVDRKGPRLSADGKDFQGPEKWIRGGSFSFLLNEKEKTNHFDFDVKVAAPK